MPTLALFCSLCCASARHRLSHLRPSNLSFLFPPLNVVYEGRLTRWEANDKSRCRDRIRDGEGKKNLARLEMCLCFILYRIRKLKKNRKERSNQVQQQLDFYQTIQSFGTTEVFYLCSAAWCIMHTRRCQIRLLCDFFFLWFFFFGISSHGVVIANETKVEVAAFKLQTYLVVRRGCWLYEDVQHVRFRAAVVTYVGHYGESGEDGGSTVQVRAAKGILSTSTRIFCSCHLGSKRAASVLIGFVVFHFLYRSIGFEEPLFG